MNVPVRLLLVGCGKMGGALLQGVRAARDASRIVVIDPSPPPAHIAIGPELVWLDGPAQIDPFFKPDVILLAIKPQQMAAALPLYASFKNSLFLSIAAGITLAKLGQALGDRQPIIRAMPNLPASIGEGVTVAVANRFVTPQHCALADALLQAVGETAWIEDEGSMDAVTALSGSGPAYVFALCEAMTQAGVTLGLPEALAERLALRTVTGSGALLGQVGQNATRLRQAVTSPGGTTEAALKKLTGADGLQTLMLAAMQAAAERSAQLAREDL